MAGSGILKMKVGVQGGLLSEALYLSVHSSEEKTHLKCVLWGRSNYPPYPMAAPVSDTDPLGGG